MSLSNFSYYFLHTYNFLSLSLFLSVPCDEFVFPSLTDPAIINHMELHLLHTHKPTCIQWVQTARPYIKTTELIYFQ